MLGMNVPDGHPQQGEIMPVELVVLLGNTGSARAPGVRDRQTHMHCPDLHDATKETSAIGRRCSSADPKRVVSLAMQDLGDHRTTISASLSGR